MQRNTTAAFNRNVTSPLVRMANPKAHPLTPGLMGMNVNLVFRLLHKGRLDRIDYISSGASLLAGVKATAARAHLLVTAVQTVEFAVRRYQYDSYVGKLHASFSVDYLKKNTQASSLQLSREFRKHTNGKHCQGR